MNIYELFPSRYVAAVDLNGHDVTVKIKEVVMEEMGAPPEQEEKPVVYFQNAKKAMVLNKTNAMTITGLYGPDTDNWVGKSITLYAAKVKAFGAVQDAIRIRSRVPAATQKGPDPQDVIPPPPPDDGPDLDDDGEGTPFDDVAAIPH